MKPPELTPTGPKPRSKTSRARDGRSKDAAEVSPEDDNIVRPNLTQDCYGTHPRPTSLNGLGKPRTKRDTNLDRTLTADLREPSAS